TNFPFRLQLEQNQLCEILLDALNRYPNVRVEFESEVVNATDRGDEVEVEFVAGGETRSAVASYAVGADGAHSLMRERAGIGFEGSTYPFTMLTLSTFADMARIVDGVSPVTYVFDSERAMAFLRIKDHWRISLNTTSEMPRDREKLTDAIIDMASAALGHVFDR